MNPTLVLTDTRSLAMGEALCAATWCLPIDSGASWKTIRAESYLPYFQTDLWHNSLYWQQQEDLNRYALEFSGQGSELLLLGLRGEKLMGERWQAGLALHYAYGFRTRHSSFLLEQHLLFFPQEHWRINLLLWHLGWLSDSGDGHRHGFHLAGSYCEGPLELMAELAYRGRSAPNGHYAICFKDGSGGNVHWEYRLGCRLPQARPSVGAALCWKNWQWNAALFYDFRLGPSAMLGCSYCYDYAH